MWRAILIGLCLMPLLAAWQFVIEVVFYCFGSYAAPFFNVVVMLFLLSLANQAVHRFAPRHALDAGELIVVYAMLSIQGALASHNMQGILITYLAHPWKYATPENRWAELFLERLPEWAFITKPEIYDDYYLGNSTYWVWEHFRGWVKPMVVWSSFITVLLWTMLSINLVLRRRWIEHERLSYPVLQLPLALANRPGPFYANRMMWGGFLVSVLLGAIAGLHKLHPALPGVPIGRHSLAGVFSQPPWNAIAGTRWAIYPWAIGIGFLMPLDLSVSCVLFYLLHLAAHVIGQIFGWRGQGYPWADDQAWGAYVGILVMGVWVGRQHFAAVLRHSLTFRGGVDQHDRADRRAVWCALAGIAALSWFATKLGLPGWLAVAFFVLYFMLAVTITRIRAELGFPTHDMHNMSPPYAFTRLFTPQAFHPNTLTGFASLWWFNRVYASHPMPHQLEAYKMAETTATAQRRVTTGLIVAALVAPYVIFLVFPTFYYQLGSASARVNNWGTDFGKEGWGRLAGWLTGTVRFDAVHLWASGFGFVVALALGAVRVRVIGWPIHPLAYAIANSWGMQQLWTCLLMAALIKWLMLRGGGLSLYRRFIPFFLGLTLGDFVIGSFWNFHGMIFHYHPYDFWPGEIPT